MGNRYFAFFLIALLSILIYSNTFSASFHFDDESSITENDKIKDLSNFLYSFGHRHVGFFSFALNYSLGGLNVFGYHLVNLFIHILNGFLVYTLISLSFKTPALKPFADARPHFKAFITLAIALIFVTHPVQTQAVTYIAQRFTSLATLFYILSLILYIKARLRDGPFSFQGRAIVFYTGAILSAMLAMGTKEISFTLPFVMALYEFAFLTTGSQEKSLRNALKKRILPLIPFFLILPIIPLSFTGINKSLGDLVGEVRGVTAETTALSRWDYLFTQFRVIVTYLRLLLFPVHLNLDYDYPIHRSPFDPEVLLSFLLLLAIFAFGIYLFRLSRSKGNAIGLLFSFGLFWFLITLSVESSVIPIRDVIFEHRLYLPSIGLLLAFIAGIVYGMERLHRGLFPPALFLIVTIFILSIATFERNKVWHDEVTLWEDVVKKSPNKARGYNNLGVAWKNRGEWEKALRALEKAVRLNPSLPDAHANLALLYDDIGDLGRADLEFEKAGAGRGRRVAVKYLQNEDQVISEFEKAIELNPSDARVRTNLGVAYRKKGLLEKAVREFQKAVDLDPSYWHAYNDLGVTYREMKRWDEALPPLREAIRLQPRNPVPRNNLGLVYMDLGRLDEAIQEFAAALEIDPGYAFAYNNLGLAYRNKGERDRAIAQFQKALEINPDYAEAHNNLGILYGEKGQLDQAIREFEAALRINPSFEGAKRNLQMAYHLKTSK